ncbi:SIS domain-containing protein [Streptomyces vinaceus]|uniref:SIS domain-containing protein n=1 Tax=Streptomyces vinaceus TaxID=1960 RepID=UPI001678CE7A|nr:sugar isomerase [Streptomyces vinaceus]GHE27490.1 glucosamine--fructose-6-phosphate aminotransferase [Streptomyces vinaceus]
MSAPRITFLEGQAGQGAALARIADRVRSRLASPDCAALRTARRPLFTGIGASYAALAVPVQQLRTAGVVAQRVLSSEIEAGTAGFDTDCLIAVSQGGRSCETIAAFRRAAPGLTRTAVLNVVASPLGALADLTVDLGGEPDSHASTVGYTGTVVALDLVAGAVAGRDRDPWGDIAEQATAVHRHAAEVVAGLRGRGARCAAADAVAAGASRASAEEGALLLREVARMPAAACATRNYLHGAMESAGNTLHLVLGDGREIELARSLAAAGHLTLLLTTTPAQPSDSLLVIRLPEVPDAVRAVLEAVALQELAAQLGAERGVPTGSSVFAHDDTKLGGLGRAGLSLAAYASASDAARAPSP